MSEISQYTESLHEECGVFGMYDKTGETDMVSAVYSALYALQHRGQESCGIVVGDDGLFRTAGGEMLAQDETLRLTPEAIEGSNVSPVQAMTAMIANSRGFDMNMKVIRTADENAQKANQLLSVS